MLLLLLLEFFVLQVLTINFLQKCKFCSDVEDWTHFENLTQAINTDLTQAKCIAPDGSHSVLESGLTV